MNGSAHTNGHANGNGSASLKQRRRRSLQPSASASSSSSDLVRAARSFSERWEVPRKALHSSIGFVTLGMYFLRPAKLSIIVQPLCGALAIISTADAIRLRSPAFERTYERFLGPFMRESEKTSVNGVVWYLVGVIFVLSLYPRDVAVESILLLSWADTAASVFGRAFGHLTPRLPPRVLGLPIAARKSLAGVLGAFGTSALTTLLFWGFWTSGMGSGIEEPVWGWSQPNTGGWLGLILLSAGAGAVTSFAEVLDLGTLDDNLTLPIISGALVWAITYILDVISYH